MAIFTGLFAAIGGLLSSTFLSGAVGTALLRIAVGVGLSLLSRALAGTPKQQASGVNGKLQAGGDVSRSIIFGKTCTAGSLVYANTFGENSGDTPNAWFTQVIALADHQIKDITGLWVNGQPVTVGTTAHTDSDGNVVGYPIAEYKKKGKDSLWIHFYDGTQTAADPFLVNRFSGSSRPYPATRVGKGCSYVIMHARADRELFTGFPTFKFELSGRPLYDVSRDSSVGGVGTQRWDNPATWGGDGDDLPAVQIYNLLRGVVENGSWLYGLQSVTAARLPAADWIAQINKCRTEVDGAGKGAQYLTGAEVTVDTPIHEAIDKLLTGCQGRLIETGGIYKIRVGEPDAAIMSFTDDDILSTESQSFTPFFGLADTINGVSATYPEPEEAWNTKTAPPLYNATYEDEDGSRRLMTSVDMSMVYRSIQVQRIMKQALAEARRARRHTFVLPPKFWALEPGDVVSWTSARNGYVTKLFRVDGVADKANLDVTVDMTEVDPADYDWNPTTDYTPPVFSPVGPVYPPAQAMTGWQVAPATLTSGSNQMPSIQVSFDGNLDDVQFVRVQVRLAGAGAVVFDGTVPYGDPVDNTALVSVILNGTFLPDTDYEVRGIFVPYSGRETDWSAWLSVTTPNVWISGGPVDIDQLNDDIQDWQRWVGDSIRAANEAKDRLDQLVADQNALNYGDKQELHRSITASYQTAQASWSEDIYAATGPDSAIVLQITQLQTTVNDDLATAVTSLQTEIDTVDGKTTANATAITGLQTQVDDVESSVSIRGEASASPGDGWSRYSAQVRTGSGDNWSTAAFFLDAKPGVSRIVLVADQTAISDGTNIVALFTAGTTFIDNARIKNLTADNISAAKLDATQVLQDGTLITDLLAFDTVTDRNETTWAGSAGTGSGWITRATITAANPNPNPMFISYRLIATASCSPSGSGSITSICSLRIVRDDDGVLTQVGDAISAAAEAAGVGNSDTKTTDSKDAFFLDIPAGKNCVYKIQSSASGIGSGSRGQTGDTYIKLLWWKR